MPDLPARPDLEQLRHQANDLLRAGRVCEPDALNRLQAVAKGLTFASAQPRRRATATRRLRAG